MTEDKAEKQSELINVLREGVAVVQMVLFKELRNSFVNTYPDRDATDRAMLVGAIINALFGTENPEEKFQQFNQKNRAVIEQELIGLPQNFPKLMHRITDALRIQVLCDSQEGEDSAAVLEQAKKFGILIENSEVPLPSTFITRIRQLGEEHGLTVAPVQITDEDDELIQ
jgi:hypothetical protein